VKRARPGMRGRRPAAAVRVDELHEVHRLAVAAREREGRAPPGAAGEPPSPAGCSAPERRADAAVAEVCSVASWGGGIPVDRRPAPAQNPVTRWLSALCRAPRSLSLAPTRAVTRCVAGMPHCVYPERVHIVGQVSPADMAGYPRAADPVLVPSFEEGLPNVCMDAGSCGCAVLGGAVGGIPDMINHGETGLVLPAGDPRAWSDALVSAGRQSESLREMGQRAGQDPLVLRFA
jgi:Glycosyl transferases group 1